MIRTADTLRRGVINQGGFFSPYYLFDLLDRQHHDELDPEHRDIQRKLLRQTFRKAFARYGSTGSTPSEAAQTWHNELFEALGFRLEPLAPIETPRQGAVPIARAAPALSPVPAHQNGSGEGVPLIFVDLHGFGTNLDRDRYASMGNFVGGSAITDEPIARAIEFALDASETRWAIVAAGEHLRLYRKGGSVARQYLEINFSALFDADRDDEWMAFWGLLRYAAFVPNAETGKCLLDRVLDESQRHASRIADDLRENIVLAVEALLQGVLDAPANRALGIATDAHKLEQVFQESLYFMYRLLFVLYAESRDLLPMQSAAYRDGYSLEHLRDIAEQTLHNEDADKTYFIETLRTLFKLLRDGFPATGSAINPGFRIPPFNGQLFSETRTHWLDQCHIPDRAMCEVIRELSLSHPRKRNDQRERYSYADLGVDQLGSIYEGLLVYEPFIAKEDMVIARVKTEDRLISRAQADAYELSYDDESVRRSGTFTLRLWGGRRKGSGSYYTPQEITSFLVKVALEPLVTPIIEACQARSPPGGEAERPGADESSGRSEPGGRGGERRGASPDDILDLKVCDPAMGSGAFLIQACRYLAEAYGRARIAAGLDKDGRMSAEEFSHFKRRVAEKCLYGVDLNPLAVELAKVSLWLETLATDRPLTFLDAHLRCGNSLIGAPLRDADGNFSLERLLTIPDEALKEVSKEATAEQKTAARDRIHKNKLERERTLNVTKPKGGGKSAKKKQAKLDMSIGLPLPFTDWNQQLARELQTALQQGLQQRAELEQSDEDLSAAQAAALVHQKAEQLDQLEHAETSAWRKAKAVCDLWCAVWFWSQAPAPSGGGGLQTPLERGEGPLPPTTQPFLELASAMLGTDEGSLSAYERAAYWRAVEDVRQAQRFFHWELEFPEVWRDAKGTPKKNGGFDAVLANPPWELLQTNSKEFYTNFDPLFKTYKKQDALRRISEWMHTMNQ